MVNAVTLQGSFVKFSKMQEMVYFCPFLQWLIPLKAQKCSLKTGVNFGSKHSKRKKGSFINLKSHKEVFIVPIISIVFEKLFKNRITPIILKQSMSNFQNSGSKGKSVENNLLLLRALSDHSKHMGKQLWLTFNNIEKCFDSLWLEDCINSLWDNGVKHDTLSLIL